MKNLINMVLDVRKMEVGESKLQIQPHPLNQWIEHVSQDFISEGEAKNVHIRYQLDPRIEKVSFDKDKCEIILSNLLINALKHSPQDAEITITSELLSEKNSVRISIIDRGNGNDGTNGRPCNGLPDKFGLAHVIVFQPLGKVGVFFLGHAGFDHMAAVGCVIFFLQALTSFLARQGA